MKSTLLVIDYINGIINGSCKAYAQKYPILANVNKLIAACREKKIPIYFIRVAFDDSYTNLPKHSKIFNTIREKGLLKLGNNDTDFVAELDFQKDDFVVNKTTASPFYCTELMDTLKANQVERLIFAGVASDNAINIGVREAHDAGFYTVIAKDTCGASREDFHQWALTMLDKIANDILTTDELLKII